VKKFHPPQKVVQKGIEREIYSRAVIEDLWADRMTSITSSIVFEEFSDVFTYKRSLKRLGLERIANIDSVKVINGHGYLNCRTAAYLLEYLPPMLRFREIEKMFPPSVRNTFLNTPFNVKKVISMLPRVPLLLEDPSQIPFLTDIVLKKFLEKLNFHIALFLSFLANSFLFSICLTTDQAIKPFPKHY
jgi:hypothetical protein